MQTFQVLKNQADVYFEQIINNTNNRIVNDKHFLFLLVRDLFESDKLIQAITEELFGPKVCLQTIPIINQPLTTRIALQQSRKCQNLLNSIWSLSLLLLENSKQLKYLQKLVDLIYKNKLIDQNILLNELPDKLLKVLIDRKIYNKKLGKAYFLTNFNSIQQYCLHNNVQIYSKIIVLVCNLKSKHEVNQIYHQLNKITCFFNLHPYYVLSMIINFTLNGKVLCIELLKCYSKANIISYCKFILSTCQSNTTITYLTNIQSYFINQSSSALPSSLQYKNSFVQSIDKVVQQIILILLEQIISFQQLDQYLIPNRNQIIGQSQKKNNYVNHQIHSLWNVSTEEISQNKKKQIQDYQNVVTKGQWLFSTRMVLMNKITQYRQLKLLISIWKKTMFQCNNLILMYQSLLYELCQLLKWLIEPIWKIISIQKYFNFPNNEQNQKIFQHNNLKDTYLKKQPKIYQNNHCNHSNSNTPKYDKLMSNIAQLQKVNNQFYETILEILEITDFYIGFDSILFTQLCRIFFNIVSNPTIFQIESQTMNYHKQQINIIIKLYLLPAHTLQEHNPALSMELWKLLICLSYQQRYFAYQRYYTSIMSHNFYINKFLLNVKRKQTIIFNNIDNSKNNRLLYSKSINKIASNQSFQLSYWIINKLTLINYDYQSIIPDLVFLIKQCQPITIDVIVYTVIQYIEKSKQQILKGIQLTKTCKNLLIMLKQLLSSNLTINLEPIINYIIVCLNNNKPSTNINSQNIIGLYLLQCILDCVFPSTYYTSQYHSHKFKIIFGGVNLVCSHLQIINHILTHKAYRFKIVHYLVNRQRKNCYLQNQYGCIVTLLIKCKDKIVYNMKFMSIENMGTLIDKFNNLIMLMFISYSYLSQSQSYLNCMISLQQCLKLMISDITIPIEYTMMLYRSILPHISELSHTLKQKVSESIRNRKRAIKNKNYLCSNFRTYFWLMKIDCLNYPKQLYLDTINYLRLVNNRADKECPQQQHEVLKYQLEQIQDEQTYYKYRLNWSCNEQTTSILRLDILQSHHHNQNTTRTTSKQIREFIHQFTKQLLLPRLLLSTYDAMYCACFVLNFLKCNRLSLKKIIKFIYLVIQYTVQYLPVCTQKQAANCLPIFIYQLMSIFEYYYDYPKFHQVVMKEFQIRQQLNQKIYTSIEVFLYKIYDRIWGVVSSIHEEYFMVRNGLIFCEKLAIIPAYFKQAQKMQQYLNQLKLLYPEKLKIVLLRFQCFLRNSKVRLKKIKYIQELKKKQYQILRKNLDQKMAKIEVSIAKQCNLEFNKKMNVTFNLEKQLLCSFTQTQNFKSLSPLCIDIIKDQVSSKYAPLCQCIQTNQTAVKQKLREKQKQSKAVLSHKKYDQKSQFSSDHQIIMQRKLRSEQNNKKKNKLQVTIDLIDSDQEKDIQQKTMKPLNRNSRITNPLMQPFVTQ